MTYSPIPETAYVLKVERGERSQLTRVRDVVRSVQRLYYGDYGIVHADMRAMDITFQLHDTGRAKIPEQLAEIRRRIDRHNFKKFSYKVGENDHGRSG